MKRNCFKKLMIAVAVAAMAMAAKADYWMTFCRTPSGQQYSQIGYAKPDADGFVTIKAGPIMDGVVPRHSVCGHSRQPRLLPHRLRTDVGGGLEP